MGGAGKCEGWPHPLAVKEPSDSVDRGAIAIAIVREEERRKRARRGETCVGHLSASPLPTLGLPGGWLSLPAFGM